jgi:hypothetical protein
LKRLPQAHQSPRFHWSRSVHAHYINARGDAFVTGNSIRSAIP